MASPGASAVRSGTSVAIAVIALLLVPACVAAQTDPPPLRIIAPPAIPPTALVGQTLTPIAPGTWEGPEGIVASYQWRRCDATGLTCEALGATPEPTTYAVIAADAGRFLYLGLTVAVGTETVSATSSAAAVPLVPPSSAAPPTVDGAARDGMVLLASQGGWLGSSPLAFAYQWQRCAPSGASCSAVPGATIPSYPLSGADLGLRLRVEVTASNPAGTAAAQSAPTDVVAPIPLVNVGPPAIEGEAEVDRALIALPGSWTPTSGVEFLFRWLRCKADRSGCEAIPGANRRRYDVRPADVGSRLRVRITAIADAGAVTAESAQTAVVPAPPRAQEFIVPEPQSAATPSGPEFLDPFPRVRIKGYYTRRGARLELITVEGLPGAEIRLACRGGSCPYRHRDLPSRRRVRLRALERFHTAGTRIVIRVTSTTLIGKHTRVVIRRGRKPARRDSCLLPHGTKPVRCPGS